MWFRQERRPAGSRAGPERRPATRSGRNQLPSPRDPDTRHLPNTRQPAAELPGEYAAELPGEIACDLMWLRPDGPQSFIPNFLPPTNAPVSRPKAAERTDASRGCTVGVTPPQYTRGLHQFFRRVFTPVRCPLPERVSDTRAERSRGMPPSRILAVVLRNPSPVSSCPQLLIPPEMPDPRKMKPVGSSTGPVLQGNAQRLSVRSWRGQARA